MLTACLWREGERVVSIPDDAPRLARYEASACPMRVHEGALRVGVGVITESNLS